MPRSSRVPWAPPPLILLTIAFVSLVPLALSASDGAEAAKPDTSTSSSSEAPKQRISPEAQDAFLRAFEFSTVPTEEVRRSRHKIEIPEFLIEQYKLQTGMDVDTTHFRQPGSHTGYANTLSVYRGTLRAAKGGLHTQTFAEFNFRDHDNNDDFQAAFLKVYWEPRLGIKRKSGSFKTRVSDLLRYDKDPGRQITSLLDVKKIHHRDAELDEGWYEFDVSGAATRWIRSRPKRTRLVIDKGQIRLKNKPHLSIVPEGMFTQAYLLVYTESAAHRERRAARKKSGDGHKRRNRHRRKKGHRRQPCQRHSMYVDFINVGWNDWIVAPPGYDAFVCQGECRFPLPDHANATNHAVVQTLVNGVNPAAVPQACCVPTQLSPISMLYLDEYEKVVLKNYENMVVEGCGCR